MMYRRVLLLFLRFLLYRIIQCLSIGFFLAGWGKTRTALIFAADNPVYFLRGFLAAASKPHFHNRVKAAFKKGDMVGDVMDAQIAGCLAHIVQFSFMTAVISQFEVGAVE